ncbi:hypothetical protein CYMTET_53871 [Cymbomonas tetramitiformis]|uniref:C2 domain-containing protein n=1 Tax=Cymbomonas tetramitiformis TaxID=36881 RepID=A0AAE0BHW0_9CHLO|nr:hypothetical protein CYMTET_53871 [Cymbomonas tetramitiformis]
MGFAKGLKRFVLGKKKIAVREDLGPFNQGCTVPTNSAEVGRNLVIQILKATNLPKLDVVGHSDPFVRMWVINSKDKDVSDRYSTLVHNDTGNPIYNSVREIECTPSGDDALRLDMYDYDIPGVQGSDDFMGRICVPVKDLVPNQVYDLPLRNKKGKETPARIIFKRIVSPPTLRKRVYVIRHGESKWNEAQESNNLVDMLKTVDHSLNEVGVQQAQGLEARWKPIFAQEGTLESPVWKDVDAATQDVWEADFFRAGAIFASPLTRAVETALLGLKGHPTLSQQGLTLLRNLREVKNVGGQDTVGKEIGDGIKVRVKKELESVLGEGPQVDDCLAYLDVNDCTSEWWSNATDVEVGPAVKDRLNDVTSFLKFQNSPSIILVGHSLYFREFVRAYLAPEFSQEDPEMAKKIWDNKLANAACLGLDMDFSAKTPSILRAKFLFGTTVADH